VSKNKSKKHRRENSSSRSKNKFSNRFTNGKRFLRTITNSIKDKNGLHTARTRDQTETNFSNSSRRLKFPMNMRMSSSLSKLAKHLKVDGDHKHSLKEHANKKFNRKIDLLKHRIGKSRDILKDIKDQFKFNKEKLMLNQKVYSNRSLNSFNRLAQADGKIYFNNKERSKRLILHRVNF
jgi:hypothetical protein